MNRELKQWSDEMSNKYKIDGDEICCVNCGLPAQEYFEIVGEPKSESWFNGNTWYCTNDCYEEKKRMRVE